MAVEPTQLVHEIGLAGTTFGAQALLLAAKELILKSRLFQATPDRLAKMPFPAIATRLSDRSGFDVIRLIPALKKFLYLLRIKLFLAA